MIKDLLNDTWQFMSPLSAGDLLLYGYIKETADKNSEYLINISELISGVGFGNIPEYNVQDGLNRLAAHNLIRLYDAEYFTDRDFDALAVVVPITMVNSEECRIKRI